MEFLKSVVTWFFDNVYNVPVLIRAVGGDARRDLLGDQVVDPVGVGPADVAELVVERGQDV